MSRLLCILTVLTVIIVYYSMQNGIIRLLQREFGFLADEWRLGPYGLCGFASSFALFARRPALALRTTALPVSSCLQGADELKRPGWSWLLSGSRRMYAWSFSSCERGIFCGIARWTVFGWLRAPQDFIEVSALFLPTGPPSPSSPELSS
jgi:hypothetical protein